MASPVIPEEFYTLQSMLTLTGSAGATFLICNGLQRALDFNPRWVGLAVAEALAIAGTLVSHDAVKGSDYFVAIVNGFLIYATAAGATNIGGGSAAPATVDRGRADERAGRPIASAKRRFLSPWF